MKKSLFLFFALISVFIIFLFFSTVEFDFHHLFLGTLFSNHVWLFVILGITIFICGKQIIDDFEKENLDIKK